MHLCLVRCVTGEKVFQLGTPCMQLKTPAHRSAVAFMGRSDVPPDANEVSQVPTKGRHHMHGVYDCARLLITKPFRWEDVAFSSAARDRHLEIGPVSQLDTQPVVFPVNASS